MPEFAQAWLVRARGRIRCALDNLQSSPQRRGHDGEIPPASCGRFCFLAFLFELRVDLFHLSAVHPSVVIERYQAIHLMSIENTPQFVEHWLKTRVSGLWRVGGRQQSPLKSGIVKLLPPIKYALLKRTQEEFWN